MPEIKFSAGMDSPKMRRWEWPSMPSSSSYFSGEKYGIGNDSYQPISIIQGTEGILARKRPHMVLCCPHKRNWLQEWLYTCRWLKLQRLWNGTWIETFSLNNLQFMFVSRRGSDSTCIRSWKWRKPTCPVSPCLKISKRYASKWVSAMLWHFFMVVLFNFLVSIF